MEETKKIKVSYESPIKNGEDTRLWIIQKLIKEKKPISMYKFAKENDLPTSQVYYHFSKLMECCVILQDEKKYCINPCFQHLQKHIKHLVPFLESLLEDNPLMSEEQLNMFATYILTIISIEVSDNED